ncbi:hypothetical protein D7V86_25685, partial [bacterium D16-51]
LANIDCVGQDEPCKENPTPTENKNRTGGYKESNYIETGSDSHSRKNDHELFCVTKNDIGSIDMDDLFDCETVM